MAGEPVHDIRSEVNEVTASPPDSLDAFAAVEGPQSLSLSPAQQLKVLAQIHGMTGQEALLDSGAFEDSGEARAALFHELLQLAEQGLGQQALFSPLPGILSEQEYVLPAELESIHEELVAHLLSDKTNAHLPYRGLLLHGIKGTGKTEYAQYLAYCLGEGAEVVIKSVASIRNAPSPGVEIERFYRSVEERALREGKYYAVLFDEGDQLFSPLSSTFSSSVVTTADTNSQRRSHSQSRTEKSHGGTIDDRGTEILNALKSALGRGNTRVFTLVTSNLLNFPEEIYRDGRLLKVQLRPIGMPTQMFSDSTAVQHVPIYYAYKRKAVRILDIMQAAHHRMDGEGNPAIAGLIVEIKNFFKQQSDKKFNPKLHLEDGALSRGPKYLSREYIVPNSDLMKNFLDFFGYPIDFDNLPWRMKNRSLDFDGIYLQRSGLAADLDYGTERRVSAEVKFMNGCIPSKVAGYYAANKSQFDTVDNAKKSFAELLFPQLSNYAELQVAIAESSAASD